MTSINRRSFFMGAAAFVTGCVGHEAMSPAGASSGAGGPVRAPSTGQSWRYAKRDLVTGNQIDTEVCRVSNISSVIELSVAAEGAPEHPAPPKSWGSAWLQHFADRSLPVMTSTTEIQSPWGQILVDPHWSEVQAYREPLPLWPTELRPGWSKTFNTLYMTPTSEDELPWQLTMTAHDWETVNVPAGRFQALRYTNLINMRFTNVSGKVAGQRTETLWMAPQVGRFIARESTGTFYQDVGEQFNEPAHRWELLGYT